MALLRHGRAAARAVGRAARASCGSRDDPTTAPTAPTGSACRCAAKAACAARSWCRATTRRASYSDEDRALLEYVAQHILTALDRRQAHATNSNAASKSARAQLQEANRVLQAEIVERQRAERLQRALFRIAELSITSESLERFYAEVHDVVGELLYARNFYIALLAGEGDETRIPVFHRRTRPEPPAPQARHGHDRVRHPHWPRRARRPQRDRSAGAARARSQPWARCRTTGWACRCSATSTVVGVIAVQSYSPAVAFTAARPGTADLRRAPHRRRPAAQAGAGTPEGRARRTRMPRRRAHARTGRAPTPN